ncbi:MAG: helix-turn-helix domain-containing protein [Erysipelotrichaceae bacterium]|nr:helix-turn-helix domain-containing protein [Erysipelotrichaceae bacterium]
MRFKEGTVLEVRFQDGLTKSYDIAVLFAKYPQLKALRSRELFCSGRLQGYYGIVWNEELDLETETVYEEGITVHKGKPAPYSELGEQVQALRAEKDLSQKELALLTGIDQSDISRIERGTANLSLKTLQRLAEALGAEVKITLEKAE